MIGCGGRGGVAGKNQHLDVMHVKKPVCNRVAPVSHPLTGFIAPGGVAAVGAVDEVFGRSSWRRALSTERPPSPESRTPTGHCAESIKRPWRLRRARAGR